MIRRPTRADVLRLTGLGVVTALIVVAARKVDWSRAAQLLVTAKPSWVVAAVIANAGILFVWAFFWRALRPAGERPAAYSRMFEIVATASALMNTVPFGGGHASSVVLLIRRGSTSRRGALSVLALDQLGEGIAKVGIFTVAALLLPLPGWMRAGITTATLVVAGWLLTLLLASRWTRGLEILRSWSRSLRALGCVLMMKGAEALAIAAVQHAFGVDISMRGTLLVLAAVVLGTMLPVAPGNLGTYEGSVFVAYHFLGVPPDQALSLAIMQHLCFMLPSIGVGYVYLSAHTLARRAIASR